MRKYLRVDEEVQLDDELESTIAADGTPPAPPVEKRESAGIAIVRSRLS
jgi:hypothetical protein